MQNDFYYKEKIKEHEESINKLEDRLNVINNKLLIIYFLLILKILEGKEALTKFIGLLK